MKKPILVLMGTVIFAILLSVLISVLFYGGKVASNLSNENLTKNKQSMQSLEKSQNSSKYTYEKVDSTSPSINVYNSNEGTIMKIDIETFLYGVVASEMSSDFSLEALKAQAIAARTYIIYKEQNNITQGHSGAYVCTNSSHCQAYASYEELKSKKGEKWMKDSYPKIKKAVDETKGHILTYDDKAILPLYFSTSSGKTENCEEVFASNYPYLKSVNSPYEEQSPKYYTEKKITTDDFLDSLKNNYNISISKNNLKNQLKILDRTSAGSVSKIKIADKIFTGKEIRNIFGLNSANFDIDLQNDIVVFKVKGYGHGVGMSQWGAEGMAKQNYKYDKILFHYYKGTEIKDIY